MPAPDPHLVLKLAADMVAAQKQLESLQAQWASLFSNSSSTVTPARKPLGSTARRVLEEIDQNPQTAYSVESLHSLFGEDVDRKPIEAALFNLYKANKILRLSRGIYGSLKFQIKPEEDDMEDIFK